MNIENTLSKGIRVLKEHKISNPQLDGEILLSNSINRNKKHIILNPKEPLNQNQSKKFKSLIERRIKGEPVAYLINKKEFWKDEFYVNKAVLKTSSNVCFFFAHPAADECLLHTPFTML